MRTSLLYDERLLLAEAAEGNEHAEPAKGYSIGTATIDNDTLFRLVEGTNRGRKDLFCIPNYWLDPKIRRACLYLYYESQETDRSCYAFGNLHSCITSKH